MPMESARCSFETPPARRRERPHRARTKTERILFEVVIVEHRPRPADDGVGVNVRRVVEAVLPDQAVAQVGDRVDVVDAESVGGAHRRHQRHDSPAPVQRVAGSRLQPVDADVVLQVGRHLDDALLAEPEPPGDVQAAVVALGRRQDRPAGGDTVVHRVGKRFFDAELRAVEHRARSAEREYAGRPGRVVPDEPRRHGRHGRLGQHETVRRVVGDQVRVVDGGQQRPDDARDRRRRDDVDLRPRMSPDRHAFQLAHQQVGNLFHAAPLLGQRGLLRRRILERARPAEQRDLRLQVIDLVEGPQDREDEVGVVLAVRNGCGEGIPYPGEQFLVGSVGHAVRPKRPSSILAPRNASLARRFGPSPPLHDPAPQHFATLRSAAQTPGPARFLRAPRHAGGLPVPVRRGAPLRTARMAAVPNMRPRRALPGERFAGLGVTRGFATDC